MFDGLPDYREPPADARAHLDALRERATLLKVEDVCREFASPRGPVQALEDVKFEVRHREFICVIGASGCGKSTLIRILAGLDAPPKGQVLLDDAPVD